ncbi:hypothetical protein SEA_ACOLYTE_82 [Mycobacterium phage Acolyte]|nr:hypothetical protein SEA_ACOLYTE_82 [Mycobacterium phage Acolyte]
MTPKPIRVFVYLNLHKVRKHGKPWYSVQALEGDWKGRVIHYSGNVLLQNAKGVVRQGGRRKVLETGVKNVHAGMVGELISLLPQDFEGSKVTYNPFKYDRFVHADDASPFEGSDRVYLSDTGVRAA